MDISHLYILMDISSVMHYVMYYYDFMYEARETLARVLERETLKKFK